MGGKSVYRFILNLDINLTKEKTIGSPFTSEKSSYTKVTIR